MLGPYINYMKRYQQHRKKYETLILCTIIQHHRLTFIHIHWRRSLIFVLFLLLLLLILNHCFILSFLLLFRLFIVTDDMLLLMDACAYSNLSFSRPFDFSDSLRQRVSNLIRRKTFQYI